jgi:adenylate cyclase, class 2
MEIEYEATFENINKDKVRLKLREIGAKLLREEFMQKRVVFNFPKGHEVKGGWLRVRDEGDKITMSLKIIDGDKIEDQKESCLKVDNFDEAVLLLETIGCDKKAYQESKREVWKLDDCEVLIDEWPFLEPYLEIEGKSEEAVKAVCEKLSFDYGDALFCSADVLYSRKYGFDRDVINNQTPRICFYDENPFLN